MPGLLTPRLRWLALAPLLTAALLGLPIAAGLLGTLLPAFGYLPAAGGAQLGLQPWQALWQAPGFATSVVLTLRTGLLATLLAVLIAFGLGAWLHHRRGAQRLGALLAPVLAMPHAALAIGLAFLIAPSGWLVRWLSPGLTGWDLPPDFTTVGHASGWALVLGLLVKEVPYLMLMTLGALQQVNAPAQLAAARCLGYGPVTAYVKVVLPQLYPQLRLPIFAVLAFSLSVVDVAMILGPDNPPTLAVLAVRWWAAPDSARYLTAAAAATLLALLVALAIAGWWLAERLLAPLGRRWLARGRRRSALPALAALAAAAATLLWAAALLAMAAVALWSLAQQWRYPQALPDGWTLATWSRQAAALWPPLLNTLAVAGLSTGLSLLLVLACLENETGQRRAAPTPGGRSGPGLAWLYLPLLVPQLAFLFGAQVLLLRLGWDATLAAVVWAHALFVLPYLFLSLADPWRALDPRYGRAAQSLGASRWRVLWRIKLPLLLRPVLIACAVAVAVSVGLYLPTLFAGSGRVATLTTEAVTLSAGSDRRIIGAWALLQAALPLAVFWLATAWPARRLEAAR